MHLPHAPALTLPALRSRNYRLFFAGQGISLIGPLGTALVLVACSCLVWLSAFLLQFVGFGFLLQFVIPV